MPSRIAGSLSIASTRRPASGVAGARCCSIGTTRRRPRGDDRHLERGRPVPRPGSERKRERVVEDARDALDDRQAEPEPARHLGALVEALELAEHDLLLRFRDAEAGVPDLAG